jgi:hypothetical protein
MQNFLQICNLINCHLISFLKKVQLKVSVVSVCKIANLQTNVSVVKNIGLVPSATSAYLRASSVKKRLAVTNGFFKPVTSQNWVYLRLLYIFKATRVKCYDHKLWRFSPILGDFRQF